jgi:succinate dehydrogenase hydrophobic anchor subunit
VTALDRRGPVLMFALIRATAVLLAVLVLGHFAVTHLVTDVSATNSSFVVRRWSSALWIAWDLTMLVAALVHASCGMWLVIAEQAPAASRRRRQLSIAAISTVLLAIGTTAIVVGAARGA